MSEKIEPVTEYVRTAPESIYLQVGDDEYYAQDPFPSSNDEVTWCSDSVMALEVKYVRADIHGTTVSALEARVKELECALRVALDAIEETCNEMTVGDRFTHAGQSLLDALPSCRNVITGAKQP